MDEPAQRSGETADDALELAALALGVEDRVGHPPDPVGEEAEAPARRAPSRPASRRPVQSPARILRPPQLQGQIADDQVEQPPGGEADAGQQQEIGGYARHGAAEYGL